MRVDGLCADFVKSKQPIYRFGRTAENNDGGDGGGGGDAGGDTDEKNCTGKWQ